MYILKSDVQKILDKINSLTAEEWTKLFIDFIKDNSAAQKKGVTQKDLIDYVFGKLIVEIGVSEYPEKSKRENRNAYATKGNVIKKIKPVFETILAGLKQIEYLPPPDQKLFVFAKDIEFDDLLESFKSIKIKELNYNSYSSNTNCFVPEEQKSSFDNFGSKKIDPLYTKMLESNKKLSHCEIKKQVINYIISEMKITIVDSEHIDEYLEQNPNTKLLPLSAASTVPNRHMDYLNARLIESGSIEKTKKGQFVCVAQNSKTTNLQIINNNNNNHRSVNEREEVDSQTVLEVSQSLPPPQKRVLAPNPSLTPQNNKRAKSEFVPDQQSSQLNTTTDKISSRHCERTDSSLAKKTSNNHLRWFDADVIYHCKDKSSAPSKQCDSNSGKLMPMDPNSFVSSPQPPADASTLVHLAKICSELFESKSLRQIPRKKATNPPGLPGTLNSQTQHNNSPSIPGLFSQPDNNQRTNSNTKTEVPRVTKN